MRNIVITISMVLTAVMLTGCVERLITVMSQPSGAMVWLNDREIGATPVTTSFTWYGEYDVVLRRENSQTIKTSRSTPVPVYQWPVLDFFFECLSPFKLVDRHKWHFEMENQGEVDTDALIERAQTLRDDANTQPSD